MEKNLTTGGVFKNVILFSLPYLLSYFLQTLYGMADLFIIGQYDGVASTTAVSIGSQIMHMITVMIVGLAMGTIVSIAQAIGANNKKQASKVIGNTVVLFMGVAIVGMALLLMFVHPIVSAMSTPVEAVSGTVTYLTICFIGIPFITAYNIISSIFRGMGDSKSPMFFIAVACVANIVLDYLFMGAFRLGPAGAALGTTISQAVSVLVSLIVIIKRKSIVLIKADFKPHRPVMRKILSIGIPIAVQDGLIQVAFIVITIIANQRGLNDAAAVGIVEKIMSFLFLVPSSMLSTVSALGAQNIGADKPERAIATLRYAVLIAVGFGVLATITIQFTAGPIVSLFTDGNTSDGADVIRLGGQYLRGYIFDSIFAGIHFSFSGYFCACGKSGLSFLHNILAIVLVRIPGVYLTSRIFRTTLFPMGLATAAGSLLSVLICMIAFYVMYHKEPVRKES
ncbi:MATE family efflux transporter [Roseburia sp. MUC/MUC-530-WT-4D]|uniref:MATE family efflux transporter n=1 Tax=Roseburia porci TaxID=2605790 RepID=A0A6L5YVJ9_9FIRM|nr:MATE family efflux transporter [Roseburia porci]MST76026.1 MATE family efflux transporter [Roseburia porci]